VEAVYHEEGRATPQSGGAWQYEYSLKDHLGNTRVIFSDTNNDGVPEVMQEADYYPFGMQHASSTTATNHYLYNGKELNKDLGLDWYDYGARWLDVETGRWSTIDPLAENYQSWSGYNYVLANPIRLIDPDGRAPANEYEIRTNEDGTTTTTLIGDKGGDQTDYITYVDACGTVTCSEEVTVQVEYTSGPGNNYDQDITPTPGERVIHAKTHTDIWAYGLILSRYSGGSSSSISGSLGFAARKKPIKNPINKIIEVIDRKLLKKPKKRGDAPTFKKDGTKVEIHHENQNPDGPFKEMHWKDHRGKGNDKINHPNKGSASKIDRKDFRRAQRAYWSKIWDDIWK